MKRTVKIMVAVFALVLIAVSALADYNTPLPNNLPNWCVTEIFIGLI